VTIAHHASFVTVEPLYAPRARAEDELVRSRERTAFAAQQVWGDRAAG